MDSKQVNAISIALPSMRTYTTANPFHDLLPDTILQLKGVRKSQKVLEMYAAKFTNSAVLYGTASDENRHKPERTRLGALDACVSVIVTIFALVMSFSLCYPVGASHIIAASYWCESRTASMWRRASGVSECTSFTLNASLWRVARNVANRDAIPPQPPLPLQPPLLLVLPRSSHEPEPEPEPEILAYDDWRRGDRYEKLLWDITTNVNKITSINWKRLKQQ